MRPVVVIGEPLVAFIATDVGPLFDARSFRSEVVGAEVNVAVGLARLHVPSAVIARTGSDEFGDMVERHLRREGVDARYLRRDDRPTGLLIRNRRGFGASSVLYRRTGSAGGALAPEDVEAASDLLAGAAWLHVSGVTAALSASCREAIGAAFAIARRHGVPISFDVNYRSRLWSVAEACDGLAPLVAGADVVLVGHDEGEVLTGAATPEALVGAMRAWGASEVVVKRGADGAMSDRDGVVTRRPALWTGPPHDEVGAGDAFAAGLIAARLAGLDEGLALVWAGAVAAFCIGSVGDSSGLPTRAEVETVLARGGGGTVR